MEIRPNVLSVASIMFALVGWLAFSAVVVVAGFPFFAVLPLPIVGYEVLIFRTLARADGKGILIKNRIETKSFEWRDVERIEVKAYPWPVWRQAIVVSAAGEEVSIDASRRTLHWMSLGTSDLDLAAVRTHLIDLKVGSSR